MADVHEAQAKAAQMVLGILTVVIGIVLGGLTTFLLEQVHETNTTLRELSAQVARLDEQSNQIDDLRAEIGVMKQLVERTRRDANLAYRKSLQTQKTLSETLEIEFPRLSPSSGD